MRDKDDDERPGEPALWIIPLFTLVVIGGGIIIAVLATRTIPARSGASAPASTAGAASGGRATANATLDNTARAKAAQADAAAGNESLNGARSPADGNLASTAPGGNDKPPVVAPQPPVGAATPDAVGTSAVLSGTVLPRPVVPRPGTPGVSTLGVGPVGESRSIEAPLPALEAPTEVAVAPTAPTAPALPELAVAAARAASAPLTPPPAVVLPSRVDDRTAIRSVLESYRDAYSRMDAASAASEWPTVDTRALNRAFSTLSQQDVHFEQCTVDVDGSKGTAECVGDIQYVRRLGDQTRRTQYLSWKFDLLRRDDRWQIANVNAR